VLTRIDHVMICVSDLQTAIDAYTRIGFTVLVGGVHPGAGTERASAGSRAGLRNSAHCAAIWNPSGQRK